MTQSAVCSFTPGEILGCDALVAAVLSDECGRGGRKRVGVAETLVWPYVRRRKNEAERGKDVMASFPCAGVLKTLYFWPNATETSYQFFFEPLVIRGLTP